MRPVVGFVSPATGAPPRPRKVTIEEGCERSLHTLGSPLKIFGLPGYFLNGKHITEAP